MTDSSRTDESLHTSDRTRSRWSCCLNCFAISGLVVAALITVLYQWGKREIREEALRDAGTDQVALDKWLDEPMKIPAEYWNLPPEHSDEYLRLRNLLVSDLENDEDVSLIRKLADMPSYYFPEDDTSTTINKFIKHLELDTTDTETITSFTRAMAGYLPRYNELLAHPEYSFNSRQLDMSAYSAKDGQYDLLRPIASRALVQANSGDASGALDTMKLFVRVARVDAGVTVPSIVGDEFMTTIHTVAGYTSVTDELRSMLQFMNDVRLQVVNEYEKLTFDEASVLRLARYMNDDGFVPRLPETRREFYNLAGQIDKYVRYLEKNGNSRAEKLRRSIRGFNEILAYQVLNLIIAPIYREFHLMFTYANGYSEEKAMNRLNRKLELKYDILRLRLARRIARIEGKPELTSPEDFVPGFMETYPEDPFATNTTPLEYDDTKKDFRSVGEDGVPGTGDDLYGGENEYELPNVMNAEDANRMMMYYY